MSSFTIGNKSYSGKSVSIINGVVTIDGGVQGGEKLTGVVKIEITGCPTNVTTDAPVIVNGDVLGDVKSGGPVDCGAVRGNVTAGGPVECETIGGNLKADGPVDCGDVGGNVTADIVSRK